MRDFNATERIFLDRFRSKIRDKINEIKAKRSIFIDKIIKKSSIPEYAQQVVTVMDDYEEELSKFEDEININSEIVEILTDMIMRKKEDES